MSKYIPRIVVPTPSGANTLLSPGDPLHDQVATDVESYSITPRVLCSVTLLPSPHTTSTYSLRSVEEYEYSSNKVLRYAINAQHIVPDHSGSILGEGASTLKAGGSVSTGRYLPADSQATILHSLEKVLLEDAIRHLQTGSMTTVLVDFFERAQGREIQVENGHPCIHTVVLHKHITNKVFVIDPSNFLYSSHLANADFNGLLATQSLPQIATIHKAIQIYQPPTGAHGNGLIGPSQSQWRDCTDIAVKLAFGFNKAPLIAFNKSDIEEHPVVIRVSNLDTLDKSIFYNTKTAPIRIKQVSSEKAQVEFCKVQRSIDCKIKLIEVWEDTHLYPTSDIESKSLLILQSSSTKPIDALKALTKLNADFNCVLVGTLTAEQTDLQARLLDFESECVGLGTDFYS